MGHRLERRRPGVTRVPAAMARSTGCGERAATAAAVASTALASTPLDRAHVDDAEEPVRQRPRLVDRHGGDRGQPLEVQAALDQHAVPRRRGQRRDDRDRRAQHERARAGDDQQHQGAIERGPGRLAKASGGTTATSAASTQHGRRVARGEAIDPRLRRRPRRLARSTRWMMRASVVSSPIAVTRTSRAPVPLTVPAKTRSPAARGTGSDSPVIGAWLTSLAPATTSPSSAMRSPGPTTQHVADRDRGDRHALDARRAGASRRPARRRPACGWRGARDRGCAARAPAPARTGRRPSPPRSTRRSARRRRPRPSSARTCRAGPAAPTRWRGAAWWRRRRRRRAPAARPTTAAARRSAAAARPAASAAGADRAATARASRTAPAGVARSSSGKARSPVSATASAIAPRDVTAAS